MMKKVFCIKYFVLSIFILFFCLFITTTAKQALAGPTSTNFQLEEYGFGSGGIATSSSENFLFSGLSGEVETASLSSANFLALPGLTYTLQPNIPGPTFTNPSNYYNKLHLTINNGGYPTDTTFAIQVASNSADFSQNVYYVQADNTLGTNIVFQTYSLWGSSGGFDLIGLFPGTTYYARAAAKRGVYQQGPWSATANASTINPTLTFSVITTSQSVPPFSIDLGNLTPGSVVTSSDKVTATISTNASNGGLIYLNDTNVGLKSTTAGNYVISSATNDLSSLLEGYGARATSVTQSSGGPMQINSPYNGSGQNVGIIDTTKRQLADSSLAPVTSGQVTFELKAKAKTTTPAAPDYSDVLTLIGTGNF